MKVLFDANVILTFLTRREDKYLKEIDAIMQQCHNKTLEGFVAFHSLSIIWYLLRKVPYNDRVDSMVIICDALKVAYAENAMILHALENTGFIDFEDNLQDCCAQNVHADYIVTANVHDYEGHSVVKAVTPAEFLSILEASNADESTEVHEAPAYYELAPISARHYLTQKKRNTAKTHIHRLFSKGQHLLMASCIIENTAT